MAINGRRLLLALIFTAVVGKEHIPVLRSCSELRVAGYSNDGEYRIDPDGPGIGLPSLVVYCNMENSNMTIVDHDQMIHAIVPRGFEDAGEFRVPVTYLSSVSIQQLTKLADISEYCTQFISADCYHVAMWGPDEPWAYWVSRDGTAMPNWGTPTGTRGCQCSLDQSCADVEHQTCNCDANDSEWRQDDGELTDKSTLPVTELRFGDTGSEKEKIVYKVGPLKCRGMSETFPSCSAWAAAGYMGEGDYLIQPPRGPAEVRRCNEQYLQSPPPVLRSCEELKTAGYIANDEYWIDPDTTLVGLRPFPVYCDMATGTTILRNDRQGPLMSKGFNDKGEHRIVVHYNDASIQQVSSLVDISATCQQYISKECHDSYIWSSHRDHSEYTWWISRNGARMSNWGSPTGTEGCVCSVTAGCDRPERSCNCDSNDNFWRQDDGYITDKATLPIWELRIGDTGGSDEVAFYSVGELKCKGIGSKLYGSCEDLLEAGFSGEGHYLIDPDGVGNEVPRVVKCNETAEIKSTVVFCPNVTRTVWRPVPAITTSYKPMATKSPKAPLIPINPQRPKGTGGSQDSKGTQAASAGQQPVNSQVQSKYHVTGQLNGSLQALHFVVVGVIILLIVAIIVLIFAAMQWNKMKKLHFIINMTNWREQTEQDDPGRGDSFSHVRFVNNSEYTDTPKPEAASLI